MNKRLLLCLAIAVSLFVFGFGCESDDSSDDTSKKTDDYDLPAVDSVSTTDDSTEPFEPPKIPFAYTREDSSEPIPEAELVAFSEKLQQFYEDSQYIDWTLRMSHGVDDSTGLSDYRLWWGEIEAEKSGDTVSIIHEYSEEHGGHNILKGNSLILTSAISGYLRTGDKTLGELTRQFCNGVSQTMLGMVHDEQDPIRHLMARNVVAFNHTYTTHDGREKFVDYSNWYHPYDRWNCSRYKIENNPYWGEVWVTNTRSKDGLGYLYRAAVSIDHAAKHGPDQKVRQACTATMDLLTAFAKDVRDNDYLIRTKDSEGNPYRPGIDPEPEEANVGDAVSFTKWDILVPGAECNATSATALLGYGDRMENDCDPFGGHPIYEVGAIWNNPPNGHIMRSFHIANVALALHFQDFDAALKSLEGLEQRFQRDMNLNLELVDTAPDSWFRDLAVSLLQAANAGYYLTNDEIRMIHTYAGRAIDRYSQFENWDLWADSVPDGQEIDALPSSSVVLEDESKEYWFQTYALGLFMDYCLGSYVNPDSPKIIDCDIFEY